MRSRSQTGYHDLVYVKVRSRCVGSSCTEIRKEETLEEGNDNELRREEIPARADTLVETSSFDELAIGLADGTLTRARVLKLMGATLLGGLGAFIGISAVAGDADARRRGR